MNDRRALLAAALGALAAAACSSAPPKVVEPPLQPLSTTKLDELATTVGLVWLIRAKPRAIAQIPFLIPAIAKIVPEANFNAFELRTGLDPRQLHEAILLRYGEPLKNADAQLVRHNADGVLLEKKFFARLSNDAQRIQDRPDLVRIHGTIGKSRHGFARIGKDVAVYQQGGEDARGPVAISSLFARGKLTKAPRLLQGEPLASLVARFGDAPVVAAALGPFTDEWKKAARGLLEVSTAVGAAARPTARDNVGLAIALTGNFGQEASKAADVLRDAWNDIAATAMGHVLGFDRPVGDPVSAGDKNVVTFSIELAPDRLAEGLKALVEHDLDAIMRLE